MENTVATQRVLVANPQGLHARPANLFVSKASQFESKIEVVKDQQRVDGKSILGILTLVAEQGTELSIEANGPDAQEAIRTLARLVEEGFDELQQT